MQTFRKEFEAFYSLKSFYTPQLLKTNASVGYDSQDSKLIPHPFADTSPAHSLSQQDGLTIPSSIAEDSELLPHPFAEGVRGWGKSQIHSYQTKAFESEKSYPLHCQSESLHSKAKESKRNPSLAMQTWNNKGTYEGKIMWNRISNELCFSYDWAGHYILDSMFMITTRNETLVKYLLSVLNSNISRHWIKNNAATLGEGVYGAKIYIEKLPIPKITKQNQTIVDKIIALVDEILAIKESCQRDVSLSMKAQHDNNSCHSEGFMPEESLSKELRSFNRDISGIRPQHDKIPNTSKLESKINSLVYQLYNLTKTEIKIVESQ